MKYLLLIAAIITLTVSETSRIISRQSRWKSEMEGLASRTSSATLQLNFAENDILEKAFRVNK